MRTKLKARYLPYGALPYENVQLVTNMMAKLFPTFPYLPVLKNLSPEDSLEYRTLGGMPGVIIDGRKISIKAGTKQYEREMSNLDKIYNNPEKYDLDQYAFDSPFLDKYLNIIKKFKSPNACINFLGPFTISQILMRAAKEQMLADKSFRKLFVQSVCIKAFWIIKKIKEYCETTTPVIVLEEPTLGELSVLKRENENINAENITNMLARVIEKIHNAGAIVCVQCFDKCNLSIPIDAGADIISFDAYNNPNNVKIFSEHVKSYLYRGGKINWGIVPVISEKHVKELSIDYISKRLSTAFEGLATEEIPIDLIEKTALISLNGNADKIPVMFAEKALMLITQMASKLAIRS